MSNRKIVLIDGHSILTRAFFGVPDLTNAAGLHTNAVYGFLNILFKILEEEKPDDLAVAFDLKAPTFRHVMFKEYKGTRKPMPSELLEQVPLIQEVLKSMNVKIMTMEGFEADDILGTVGKYAESMGYDVTIVSGDRDLLQLATDKILIRIPKTKQTGTEIENYYAADVQEKYGVNPIEFIDMKGLMGDTADNIPGVKSIGEKTAAKLITQFQTIENIYDHIDEVKPERTKNALIADEENARLSKVLATINIQVPYPIDIKEFQLEDMFNAEAYKQIKSLGFKSILNKFSAETSDEAIDFNPTKNLTVVTTKEEYEKLLGIVKTQNEDCFIGYASLFSEEMMMGYVSLSFNDRVYIIENSDSISTDDLKTVLPSLYEEGKPIALFNLKTVLKSIPLELNEHFIYDCMICAYLLNPLNDSYDFDYVLNKYLGIQSETRTDLLGKKSMISMVSENKEVFFKVLAIESLAAAKSAPVMVAKLEEEEMLTLYKTIEYPLIFVLDDMEKEGVLVNEGSLKDYADQLALSIAQIEKEIFAETGEEFNINSPKQLGVILFEKMGLTGGKKTKTGYSTSADILEKLAVDTPIVSKILEYRQLTKLKSTYADGLRNYISYDGRIHGTFNQTITATGRISSTDPNLQNIPIRMPMGKKIREVFIPKPGCIFVDADYSQIELRILAHMSGDEHLIAAYNSEQDIHRITASQVFGTPLEEVTPELRSNAKAVNFGIVYGISSFGLSQDLSISKKEADTYIKQYYATYPKLKEFLDSTVENAKKDGYVTTLFGRRRPIPELKSSNFMQRSFGERAAMNSAVQGTAADIMKIGMINVYKRLKEEGLKSKILIQVHDEILIETIPEELEEVKKIVIYEMKHAADLDVVLEVGMESGNNWLEAH